MTPMPRSRYACIHKRQQRGFIIDPYRFGSFVGPLDAYTTNLWTALSIDRLLTSWTGNSMTVRESAGSTTQQIGFTSAGGFNSAGLTSFLAGADGYLNEFINQQGISAQGFAQATTANQPKVATAGTFYGAVFFDGTNDYLSSGTVTNTYPGMTMFVRGTLRSTSAVQIIAEHSTNYNVNNSTAAYYDNAAPGFLTVATHQNSPAGYAASNFNSAHPNANVQAYRWDRSAVTAATQSVLFINGTKQTRNSNADSGTLPSSTFDAQNWFLGARSGGSTFASLDLHTLLLYQTALSDADCTAISNVVSALP